ALALGLLASTPMPACPTTFCRPSGPSGSVSTFHANESSMRLAREICVTVKALSPTKKSALTPGPGYAWSVKIASCRYSKASCISGESKVHVAPSADQGAAPNELHTVARFDHVW